MDEFGAENHSWIVSGLDLEDSWIISDLEDLELENSTQSNYDPNFWLWEKLITSVVYGSICIVGLPLNFLLIYVFLRFPRVQTVTNYFIVNLSVANVCMLISIVIIIATEHLGTWPFGNLLCKLFHILSFIPNITYSLFQLALAVERYLTVCHPVIAGKWSTPLIAKYLAGILWIVSIPLMVPVILYAGTLDIGENIQHCNVDWPDSSTMKGNTQFILYLLMNAFGIPFPVILALCILIIRRCVRDGDQIMNCLQKEKLETTKLVLALQFMDFACVTPMFAVLFAFIFIRELEFSHSQIYFVILRLSYYLGYSSAVIFPILCVLLSTNFKKSFKEACSCAKTQVDQCSELNMAELQLISVTETCE